MSHTPGPWNIERNNMGYVREIASAFGDAICYGCIEDANARLIAAAPELLEAAKAHLARYVALVECGDCGNWDPEKEEHVVALRAAIARAEGTPPCRRGRCQSPAMCAAAGKCDPGAE